MTKDTKVQSPEPAAAPAVAVADVREPTGSQPITPDPVTADVEEQPQETAAEEEHLPYYIGQWAGHDNFGCPKCAYTAIQEHNMPAGSGSAAIHDHYVKEHPVAWTDELEAL